MTNSVTMLLISINKTKGHSHYNGPSSFEELNKESKERVTEENSRSCLCLSNKQHNLLLHIAFVLENSEYTSTTSVLNV